MSSKKEKLLESAQKFILKGQLDRAIKEYEQIVGLDPQDLRQRQRLAELLVRVNRKDEAIGEFTSIAKYYSSNAYYLKAIAVYKQIQKLDPANPEISVTLATLNEKQGLTGNALAEYGQALAYYEKAHEAKKVQQILENMLALDPQNPSILLRQAESARAAGRLDQSYEAFTKLALHLIKQKDGTGFDKICDRVRTLFPDRSDFPLEVISAQITLGDTAGVVPKLTGIIGRDRANLRAWLLLVDAYGLTGQQEQRKETCRQMIEEFPDELAPREQLIQMVIDGGGLAEALELLEHNSRLFVSKGGTAQLERWYQSLLTISPENERALRGLRWFYQQTGDNARLAEITERIENLAQTPPPPSPPSFAVETAPAAQAPPAVEQPGPAVVQPPPEEHWEEEIDLSSVEEEGLSFETPADGEALPGPQPVEELEPLEEEEVEFELEMEDGAFPWEEPQAAPAATVADKPAETEGEGFVDLVGELLSEVLAEEEKERKPAAKKDKYGLDGFFSAFKKGVDEQLDKGDSESHYSLGIAYKEMGLLDDAIAEFQVASHAPDRLLDCLMLQGICYRDKGEPAMAAEIFESVIARPELGQEELLNFKYELALTLESARKSAEAGQLYLEIIAIKPGFRDTDQRLKALGG